ncbi:MAG: hypothetical protein AAB599_03100 [Patescibacteria group bacterium]
MALTKKDLELIKELLDRQTVNFGQKLESQSNWFDKKLDERLEAQTALFDKRIEDQTISLKAYIGQQTDLIFKEIAGAVADITENVGQLIDKNKHDHAVRIARLEKKLES